MDLDFGFDDEDEIFQTKKRQNKSNDLNHNYKAKIITSKSFLDDSTDGLDLDDTINLNKLKADYYYYSFDYEKSIEFYKSCLDLTLKSKNLNDTLFQREIEESIAMCYSHLGAHEDALKLCEKLELKAENYSVTSANLNLRLKILNNNKNGPNCDDVITTLLRLIIMHPNHIQLWIKLANIFKETSSNDESHAKYFQICYFYINELNKHGYANRSEVMNKQKTIYHNWLEANKHKIHHQQQQQHELLEQEIIEKLEQMDKLSDNERILKSRELNNKTDLCNKCFNELYNFK